MKRVWKNIVCGTGLVLLAGSAVATGMDVFGEDRRVGRFEERDWSFGDLMTTKGSSLMEIGTGSPVTAGVMPLRMRMTSSMMTVLRMISSMMISVVNRADPDTGTIPGSGTAKTAHRGQQTMQDPVPEMTQDLTGMQGTRRQTAESLMLLTVSPKTVVQKPPLWCR